MTSTVYFPEVLEPLAITLVDQALQSRKDLSERTVIDAMAEQLYRRHRSEGKRCVKERTWTQLPNSEKGKYCKIIMTAVNDRYA